MKSKDLKKLMQSRIVTVQMSEAEVLILHALATLSDGRQALTKILRRRISPVALKVLEEREEYK